MELNMMLSDVLLSDLKNLSGKSNVTESRLRKHQRVRNLPGFYIRDELVNIFHFQTFGLEFFHS